MNRDQKKVLFEQYRKLNAAINFPRGGKAYIEQKKRELEEVKKIMARNNLSHQDFIEYKNMQRYLSTADNLIAEEKEKEKSIQSDTIKIVIGAVLIFIGMGLTDAMNGKMIFYGAILGGIALIILGILGINDAKKN